MNRIHRFGFLAPIMALFVMVSLTFARPAKAGTLQVRDPDHLLASDDLARLHSVLASASFDGRLVLTSAYPDAEELGRYVHSLANESNIVVVGVDPQHRHVQVQFGAGASIPRSDWQAIESAGNDAFKRTDWEGGAAAIFQSAARDVTVAGGPQRTQQPVAQPSFFGPGVLLLLLVGGLGVALFLARRRSMSGYTNGGAYGGSPSYGPPGYPPPQGGVGPLGGGLIGAGLGGIAGYELGKMEGEREERRQDAVGGDNRGTGEADGGGSSWDSGGSDGGGGGFDGGGFGGGDGGGGSDF